jgi:hypothetical protein
MKQIIYAVVDLVTDRCLYVGQTSNLKQRRHSHSAACKFKNLHVLFCPLRKCKREVAHIIEGQIIRAYKRKGEAELNSRLEPNQVTNHVVSHRAKVRIYCETGNDEILAALIRCAK